jgi:murein DD-endopeptidase MepM/ murein hydrolase activator NlpD
MSRSKNRSRRRAAPPWQGALRLSFVFATLIAVNVYFFFLRGGTSLRALLRATERNRGAAAAAILPGMGARAAAPAAAPGGAKPKPAAASDEAEDARVVDAVLGDHDTVERAWKRDGLPPREVGELAAALGQVFDLKTIRAGHAYTLRFDAEEHLRAVDYRVTPALAFHLERGADGWRATRDEKPLETRVVEVGGVVQGSIYDAIKRAGETGALVSWFVDMFAWDINFYLDSQAGDRVKVIVEKRYLGGKFYKYGRVLAAEYQGRVGTYRAFWFQPGDGTPGGYYTEHGESIVKALLKTPLKYVRVSSGFDRHRFHPILHSERAHLGVDYAAPMGTPVWAAASGRVVSVGPRAGGGNTIVLAHANDLQSVYMHLQRCARGLAVGQTVRQKQVIGYVGMTGLATGPHLHFSLKQNGAFVDPLRLRPPREAPLAPSYRTEFADAIAPRLTALAAIPTRMESFVARGPAPMP